MNRVSRWLLFPCWIAVAVLFVTADGDAAGVPVSAATATVSVRSTATGTAVHGMTGMTATAAVSAGSTSAQGPACRSSEEPVTLSPYSEVVARVIKFDRDVLLTLKEETGERIQRLVGYNADGFQIIIDGVAAHVPEEKTDCVLEALRRKLVPRKYLPFVAEINAGLKMDKIGVIKGTDQYEILRIMQTNGEDYELSNEDIIEQLRAWEKDFSFDIVGADNDWVEIEFRTLPKNLRSFAEEVYEFSPEAVDEGPLTIDELIKEIRKTNRLFLLWD